MKRFNKNSGTAKEGTIVSNLETGACGRIRRGNGKPSIGRKFDSTDIQTAFPRPRGKYEEALHVYRLRRIVPVRVSLCHEPKTRLPLLLYPGCILEALKESGNAKRR